MNLEDLEKEFVAEGWSNGSLHPKVVSNHVSYWNGGSSKEDSYVGFDFHFSDWEALFFGELDCPPWEPYIEGEDIDERDRRWYVKFQQCTSEYPMLDRIFDMYQDAGYKAEEVKLLRDQCLKLQAHTKHSGAWRAVTKLILACDKALERKSDLLLISD